MTTTNLKTGFAIGETFYPVVELREVTTSDLLDAEDNAPLDKPLQYQTELLRRQIVRVASRDGKEFRGPFAIGMIRKLPVDDFRALRRFQGEVNNAGELESEIDADTGNPSS